MSDLGTHCRPAACASVGGVSDRISAKAGKQIARDVIESVRAQRLMGLSLIGPLVLKEERQDEHRPGYRAVL